jgi:iron complex outermembrane recepter protein
MRIYHLFVFLLFFTTPAQSQIQELQFNLLSNLEPCDSIYKSYILIFDPNQSDQSIQRDTFASCSHALTFPKNTGDYKLLIRAYGYEEIVLEFNLNDTVSDKIAFPNLKLYLKTRKLDEVTITGIKRSFIQIDADKTTITVKDNPILNNSSVYDAILRIPGVMPYPGGGFSVYGKNVNLYFEGIPSNLSGEDLSNLLKSLPASSVEKIEIISNPGAAYDADQSGAIINIISLNKSRKWTSGTITLNSGFNNNQKHLPSLIVSGRKTKFSWQFQAGIGYFERTIKLKSTNHFTSFNPVVNFNSEQLNQDQNTFYYIKPSININLSKKSNLILNYNGTINQINQQGENNSFSEGIEPAINYTNQYSLKSDNLNNEFIATYKTKLDTLKRTFLITAYYSDFDKNQLRSTIQTESSIANYNLLKYDLQLQNLYLKSDLEIPFEKQKFYIQTGAKYKSLSAKSQGKYNLGSYDNNLFDEPQYNSSRDFKYNEDNLAGYIELKKGLKKLMLGAGLRIENFNLTQKSSISDTIQTNYLNWFPSFNAIYRFNPDMNVIASYSRKISIPSYSQFDPNLSGYYDSYNSSVGNSLLKPNFYDNIELKFSVFDYLQLSVNYSHSQTINLFEMKAEPNSVAAVQTFRTYNNVNNITYFFSIPVPFGVFKEGMEFFNNPIDIDKINFVYLYTERSQASINDVSYEKIITPIWNHGIYSQFILPWKIRLNVDYFIQSKGTFQIYEMTKPVSALELVFSKDFMNGKLKTSITIQDVLNQQENNIQTIFPNITEDYHAKMDTQIIWFKISYAFGKYNKVEDSGPNIEKSGPSTGLGTDL